VLTFFLPRAIFQIKSSQEVFWMATQVKDQLLASHEEFRRLAMEHSQYSQRLDSLIQKRYLSEEERIGRGPSQETQTQNQRPDGIAGTDLPPATSSDSLIFLNPAEQPCQRGFVSAREAKCRSSAPPRLRGESGSSEEKSLRWDRRQKRTVV